MAMMRVQYHRYGGPEVMRWEDFELPPPGAGEVRIRHTAIAVNFSDVNVRRGGFYLAQPLRFPVILGNEAAGVVASGGGSYYESQRKLIVMYLTVRSAIRTELGIGGSGT
jgi:NADPH2:quinone reductase